MKGRCTEQSRYSTFPRRVRNRVSDDIINKASFRSAFDVFTLIIHLRHTLSFLCVVCLFFFKDNIVFNLL